MKVLDCKGFKLEKFEIPPFTLNKGELINLQLFNGAHFFALEEKLVQIFTGVVKHEHVKILEKLEFAEHIGEKGLLKRLFPTTVGKYLKKNAKPFDMPLSIFPDDRLKPKTSLSRLAGNPKKFLAIYCALSKCDGLIFDLVGSDPLGSEKIFDIVKDFVDRKNGYAILLNNFDDLKEKSTKIFK